MDGGIGLDVFNLISLGVVFYGALVVSLLLFGKSSHRLSNVMLAAIITIGVWYIITSLLILTGKFVNVAYLFRIGAPFYYANPPLLFLYVKSRSDKNFRLRYIQLWHFLPVLLSIIDLTPYYFLDEASKEAMVKRMTVDFNYLLHIRTGIIPDVLHVIMRPIHGLVYVVVTGIYLRKALRDKKLRREIDDQKSLRTWLLAFILFFGLIYLGLTSMNVIWFGLPYPIDRLLTYTLAPFLLCIISFLGLHVFLVFNPHLIFGKPVPPVKVPAPEAERPQPEREGKESAQLLEIEKWVVEKELFKNPGITVPEMARIIGMPPHTLSAILNAHGKKFTDFVNTYRVKYVIAQLDKGSNENMSIEGIANEAGFASRSTFYTAFKKNTGLTPSEYLRQKT